MCCQRNQPQTNADLQNPQTSLITLNHCQEEDNARLKGVDETRTLAMPLPHPHAHSAQTDHVPELDISC